MASKIEAVSPFAADNYSHNAGQEEWSKLSLRRLEAGYLELPMHLFVNGVPKDVIRRVPSMSWLIHHKPSRTNLLFDLGIRKDVENYPPPVYERMKRLVHADVPQDVFESLQKADIDVLTDIDTVIFSHLHYDHTGNPSKFGPRTKFVIGPGAKRLACGPDTYPENKNSHFDSRMYPREGLVELPDIDDQSYWASLGPFEAAHDWFGDGSVYLINAPGHLLGHVNLLVRTGARNWVYLAGDTTHDWEILAGTADTAVYQDEQTGLPKCAHQDPVLAEKHISIVRKVRDMPQIEVILCHDSEWLERNKTRFNS